MAFGQNRIAHRIDGVDKRVARKRVGQSICNGKAGDGEVIGLKGGENHAKIGISTSRNTTYSIFGDMNQEGATLKSQDCSTSQNGRGGLFFVVENEALFGGMKQLLKGDTAGTKPSEDD